MGVAMALAAVVLMLAASPEGDGPRVRATLLAERQALTPGAVNWLGVSFDMEPEWYIYWNGMNSGFPPSFQWTLPPGFEVGQVLWPAPTRKVSGEGILDHVYKKRVMLLVPLKVPPGLKAGEGVDLRARAEWLVCKDVCIPEEQEVSLRIAVANAGEGAGPGPAAAEMQRWRARVPVAWTTTPDRDTMQLEGKADGTSVATLGVKGAKELRFFPGNDCTRLVDAIADGEVKGDVLRVRVRPSGGEAVRVEGVLEVVWGDARPTEWLVVNLAGRGGDGAGRGGGR